MSDKPFKMLGHELPGPNQKLNVTDNTIGESPGKNADLIEALKKQDEAEIEIKNLEESKNSSINSGINI